MLMISRSLKATLMVVTLFLGCFISFDYGVIVKWTPCRGQNAVKISKIFEIDR